MPQLAWVYLLIAGVFEVVWAVMLKSTQGFTRLWPSVWTIAAMLVSFYFLALAVRTLPVSTAYAVWVGIGAAGTAILGMILLGEPRDALRLACIALIVTGAVGLRVLTPAP
jgi:Membrane transporters of cations and cationic drugs